MAINKKNTIAFSGHRTFKVINPQGDLFSDTGEYNETELRKKVACEIERLHEDGFTTFLCGMAEGFDLLAGEAVLALKDSGREIKLIAVVPYPGQDRGFTPDNREIYEKVIGAADDVITVCPRYSYDCFHRRNDFLTDNASILICYYNGSPGGTAYTVKRAIRQGLRIVNTAK